MTKPLYKPEEFLINLFAEILLGVDHVAVGALSPIPGCAALLMQELAEKKGNNNIQVSIIHGDANNPFTDGGRELFDCAGQGRIGAFFLGGAEIDGEANINLLGVGDYPNLDKRFPGSFGSAYIYFVVPKIILFAPEHSKRVLVEKVKFISAPGTSPPEVYRQGGPKVLVTSMCVMSFDSSSKRFTLVSTHPGVSVEDILKNTEFDFEIAKNITITIEPDADRLVLLRRSISPKIAKTYPDFAARVFN
jgi:glutaconate CoA-transferase subunit B